ncbi:hypothetical protein D9M69_565220 [compost metagenome]
MERSTGPLGGFAHLGFHGAHGAIGRTLNLRLGLAQTAFHAGTQGIHGCLYRPGQPLLDLAGCLAERLNHGAGRLLNRLPHLLLQRFGIIQHVFEGATHRRSKLLRGVLHVLGNLFGSAAHDMC